MWAKIIGFRCSNLLLSSFKQFSQGKPNRDYYGYFLFYLEVLGVSKNASQN